MNGTTGPVGPEHDDPAGGAPAARQDAGSSTGPGAGWGEEDGIFPVFVAVRPRQVRALLAAYREAARQAEALAAAFASVGLADEVVEVSAGVDGAGRPLVRAVLTVAGACRLAAYLEGGGVPPPGLRMHAGLPPWAA